MAKLENYNGSVELMAGITQKGGGGFALVEANAVQTGEDGKRLDAVLEELNSLINQLKGLVGESTVSEQISQMIDPTLSIEGAVAEAKVTGVEINTLKSRIFVGTYAEYQTANNNNEIPINALVVITDDNDSSSGGNGGSGDSGDSGESSTSTSSKLGEGVLGYMILG